MISVLPEYWPSISHVAQWYAAAGAQLQLGGTYQKQSLLNRCKVAGVQGVLTLSVPLVGGREQKSLLTEVLIDNSQRWAVQHLRTLQSCYGKAPYFDYYFPVIENLLLQPHTHLATLNQQIIEQLVRWLRWTGSMETNYSFVPVSQSPAISFQPYVQVFSDRQPFHSNLSILDLLFCTGTQAAGYLISKAAF